MCRHALLLCALLVLATDLYAIDITQWKFKAGHDHRWAAAHFDDSQWLDIAVPGCWSNQGLGSPFGQGWYRTTITLDTMPDEDSYLYLGQVYSTDELFVNGVSIGRYGQFSPDLIEAHEAVRLYQIPAQLLHHGINTFALHVQSSFPAGGLVQDTPRFGDYSELVDFKMGREQQLRDFESISISFFLFSCCFVLFLMFSRRGFYRFWPFFLYLVIMLSITILSSSWFYHTGLKSVFIQRVSFALHPLIPILMQRIIIGLFDLRYTIVDKVLVAISLLFSIWLLSPIWRGFSEELIVLGWIVPTAALCWVFIRGVRAAIVNRKIINKSYIFGTVALVAPLIGIILEVEAISLSAATNSLSMSLAISTIFLLLLVASRYFELVNKVFSLNQHVQLIEEMERARIARDLHDQVGQRLVALKLQTQMLLSGSKNTIKRQDQETLVTDIDQCIHNIREVLNGLKPAELTQGIAQALESKAQQIERNYGLTVVLDIDSNIVLIDANRIENLYLICIEAMNNAAKHAQATHIYLSLQKQSGAFQLTVRDNGQGFNTKSLASGMGLESMYERARMLDAVFTIESVLNEGTTITLTPE